MTEDLERLPTTVVVPTGVPAELIEHYRKVAIWRRWFVIVFALFLTLGVACFGIVINHQIGLTREALAQSKENGELLIGRNTQLQKQVDSARDLLTQLYTALNASQKQVESLGGVPLHFEFTVPTTAPSPTTTQPPSGAPATTTGPPPSLTQSASGIAVALNSSALLGLVFTPMLVPLLIPSTTIDVPDTTIPITVPVVTIPPITVPDTVPVTVPIPLPPLGSG